MSHTVHPYAHRLGIIRDWKSRWFGTGERYRRLLKADITLRSFLEKRLRGLYVSDVEIERGEKTMRLIIKTSRPGMLIGRNGEGSERLRKELLALMDAKKLEKPKDFKIDIEEVRSPESNAKIVAYMIVEGLEKRMPYRRVLKQSVEKVMANRNALGVRMVIAGRLGGADIARVEELKKGRVPLQTFRADIDYAEERALLPYGTIGVKVWIYKGDVFEKNKER